MLLPILYKRSNLLDRINQWQIEIEDNKFRSISGYVDGVQTIGDWTLCEAKNVGKKNATTPKEQALAQAKSLWQKRKDSGYWEDINDCDKKLHFSPMLAHEWDKEKHKVKYPIASQPKLDGVRCILSSDGMFSRNGKEIISAPHIFESVKMLFDEFPDIILDGELYADKNEVDFNKIISLVRKTRPTLDDIEESKKYIEYYVYDIPNVDNYNEVFDIREERLKIILDKYNLPYVKLVPTYKLKNENEVREKFTEYISQGYEGQMLRIYNSLYENKRSKGLLKHKEFFTEEFEIIELVEGLGKLQNKVGTVRCKTKEGSNFYSAVNGTHEYLEEVWKNRDKYIGKLATIKFFEWTATENKVPRFPKIIEFDRFDI